MLNPGPPWRTTAVVAPRPTTRAKRCAPSAVVIEVSVAAPATGSCPGADGDRLARHSTTALVGFSFKLRLAFSPSHPAGSSAPARGTPPGPIYRPPTRPT